MIGAVEELRADCSRCTGLCCVVPSFEKSSDFAISKPGGVPCRNLAPDFRCSIHRDLRGRGFAGCTTYDCFGAGQYVVARLGDALSGEVFAAFGVTVALHEMLFYLAELTNRTTALAKRTPSLAAEVADQLTAVRAARDAGDDPGSVRPAVGALLARASLELRAGLGGADHRDADLSGRRLRHLLGASLRGATLLGADLRGADLHLADVLGADLRGAEVGGADLADALFLTQMQANAMRGDGSTRLPPALTRPAHWR